MELLCWCARMASTGEGRPVKSVVEVCALPAQRVAAHVQQAQTKAIADHGYFSLAIAGGSLVKMLGAMKDMPDVSWDKWYVAWVDERCVPHDHDESNYKGAKEAWLSKVDIPAAQILAIDESLCGPVDADAEVSVKCADEYETRLRSLKEEVLPRGADGQPSFDLLLLGFGPDGHICSLFPGHPLLEDASGRWVLPISDSPKPPPNRITLSLPAVNAANQILLVGLGDGKKEAVQSAFTPGCKLPCALAHGADPAGHPPIWVLDEAAAASLPPEKDGGYTKLVLD
mmetsp:Transcript_12091/g.26650  ORF Transcript_12091/g.26650 Transcript_12091/m.26650 type:complete len:285 (+) Transcript_12091:2-856(+)|eukprot:CAMPEP_0206551676 /NCGR_PEP_ID=MMETSP0325_2-20121206/15658_1 /ASSEMBLY_ACC=CAM_ASM_000347 /TAXON_ID=2866 /ORGANISM="Crypthecodinium cohnii, Strain Seligo" /LENGTH=284 /DNA_ID=CAMNT_0054051467 /DNA_START=1 /DNA_END=855 /DNA_ORIENTATION=+